MTVQSGVTRIPPSAFCDCPALSQVTIPDSVVDLEDHCFGYLLLYGKNWRREENGVYYELNPDGSNGAPLEFRPVAGFTLYGSVGSSAEAYAKENNFPFVGQ